MMHRVLHSTMLTAVFQQSVCPHVLSKTIHYTRSKWTLLQEQKQVTSPLQKQGSFSDVKSFQNSTATVSILPACYYPEATDKKISSFSLLGKPADLQRHKPPQTQLSSPHPAIRDRKMNHCIRGKNPHRNVPKQLRHVTPPH